MPQLVEITPEVFPLLHEAFLHDDDPWTDEGGWREVFCYRWKHDGEHTGHALVHEGRAVGMMAMAFSRRTVRGRLHRFCNLHTWWMHPDHRGHAITMLRPVLAMRDRTLTYLTPGNRVRALLKPLGFRDLDMQMRLLLPLWPARLEGDVSFAVDPDALPAEDRRLLADHAPYDIGAAVLREGGRGCLVLYTAVERYRVRYCHVHHVGDRDLFLAREGAVRAALMRRHGVRLVALDARLWRDARFPRSLDFAAPAHGLFRPAKSGNRDEDVEPRDVDNLYTDVAMLGLATMPSLRHELAEPLRRRFLPHRVEAN